MLNDSVEAPKKSHLPKVVYVGLNFTLLFTGYIAAQNLATQVYKNFGYTSLGNICVFTIFLFMGLGSVFAAHIKRGLSHKTTFVIGSIGYSSIMAAGLITALCQDHGDESYCSEGAVYAYNIVGSALVGSGACLLWLTQSLYVNACCDEQTKGTYNGVFWSLMQLSQISSSFLAAFVLPNTDKITFYGILLAFGFAGVVMYCFTPKIEEENIEKNVEEDQVKEPLSQSLARIYNAFKDRNSIFLLGPMAFVGFNIAFYANFLTLVSKSTIMAHETESEAQLENYLNQKFGYALICLAVGEVLAGLTVGKLADKFKKNHVLHGLILLPELAFILTYIAYVTNTYALVLVAAFMLGYTDTGLNTIIGSIIGFSFNGSMELFSIMRVLSGFGAMAGAALSLAISYPPGYMACIGGLLVLFHIVFVTKQNSKVRTADLNEPLTAEEPTVGYKYA